MNKLKLLTAVATFAPAIVVIVSSSTASLACSLTSKWEPDSGQCLPINDVSNSAAARAWTAIQPPPLAEMRQHHNAAQKQMSASSIPVPGGDGGGVLYRTGAFQIHKSSSLYTTMTVQPGGLNPSNNGLDWLFTTATNRTQDGVEVAGIYEGSNTTGSLGIYDWSCSSTSPCGSNSSPAWVLVADFSTLSCYIHQQLDGAGFVDNVLSYSNDTTQLKSGNPPTWENLVYLKNFCSGKWDLYYHHTYVANQYDCSSDSSCAWWCTILEPYASASGGPFPAINVLGFESTVLIHDGVRSQLSDAESDTPANVAFVYPNDAWTLYDLTPQRAYYAGNYVNELTAASCESGGWEQFGFSGQTECMNFVNSN